MMQRHKWETFRGIAFRCSACSFVSTCAHIGATCPAPAQDDSPALQSTDEGFESPGGRQPIWNERDAYNRELSARQDAKRKIISLLQDEILELEGRKLP